jgi:hypothetical protein
LPENNLDYSAEDIQLIQDLISGHNPHAKPASARERGFLFEIVANKRNSIDVDKFDYLVSGKLRLL